MFIHKSIRKKNLIYRTRLAIPYKKLKYNIYNYMMSAINKGNKIPEPKYILVLLILENSNSGMGI